MLGICEPLIHCTSLDIWWRCFDSVKKIKIKLREQTWMLISQNK